MRDFLLFIILFFSTSSLVAQQTIATERFGNLEVFRESQLSNMTVILFSDLGGINDTSRVYAKAMAKDGAQIVIIDTAVYLQNLLKENEGCAYLGGEIVRLNQSLLSSLKVKDYHIPIIAGIGQGAAFAYSIFNQKPDEFLGLITFDFCPELNSTVKLCSSEFITFNGPNPTQQILPPKNKIDISWYQLSTVNTNSTCKTGSISNYNEMFENLSTLQATQDSNNLLNKSIKQVIGSLFSKISEKSKARTDNILKLPLINLLTDNSKNKTLAIFLSGDGGWAAIDKQIASHLQEQGVSVIGFDSLKYFWKKRSPEETTKAIEDIFNKYRNETEAENLLLIGFSFGAEVLPFIIPNLSSNTKHHIRNVVLLNPGLASDFEIKISDWILPDDEVGEYNVKNAIATLKDMHVYCLYGQDDEDNACINSGSSNVKVKALPGDHHFDGDYKKLTDRIMDFTKGR